MNKEYYLLSLMCWVWCSCVLWYVLVSLSILFILSLYTDRSITTIACPFITSSYGQFRRYLKNHLFGIEKSQRSVTHDSLRYINILTYLLTYLFTFFICPIAIAYSMGQIIKSVCVCLCVCLCVCVSVRLRALSRSHFLIDFHQNWHRRKNPEK